MHWQQYVQQHGMLEWPYPIKYREEQEIETDVLVLGGGIAGYWAGITAKKMGADVVILEKGGSLKSGAGGSGCDHWLNTPNPLSPVTAEETVRWEVESGGGYANGLSRYIAARESYDTLLEMEEMGGVIRDVKDEFKGAPFRDEETKFLFAYDYENKLHFRVRGSTFKVSLYRRAKKMGIRIFDRIMVTGLLTEGGAQGARVIGAVGFNGRTGETIIVKAKASINSMNHHQRNWVFNTEVKASSSFRPPQIVGDGYALSWRAGAEFTMMEKSVPSSFASADSFPPYGQGNAINTWVPASMVDANGKEIPYEDRDGRILDKMEDRTKPSPGQKFFGERTLLYEFKRPALVENLKERVEAGEFKLPLYADLASMPEYERNAIWGHMVGEEGRTRIPVYLYMMQSGFHPSKDLLQSYLFLGGDPMRGPVRPYDRTGGEIGTPGGLLTDWNLMTNLEGYYAAGDALFAGNYHYHAAATGRYAGRKAAEFAQKAAQGTVNRSQVDTHKQWIYLPLDGPQDIEWKELNFAACRIMQNHCGGYKNDTLLTLGLHWLKDLEEKEVPRLMADNPHKLMRANEVRNVITVDEMIMHASLAREASSKWLFFDRLDFPEKDPDGWNKFVTTRLENDQVVVDSRPLGYWGDLAQNYEDHR